MKESVAGSAAYRLDAKQVICLATSFLSNRRPASVGDREVSSVVVTRFYLETISLGRSVESAR